jgi:hypothetical protein
MPICGHWRSPPTATRRACSSVRRGWRRRRRAQILSAVGVQDLPFGEALAGLLQLACADETRAIVASELFGVWINRGCPVAALQFSACWQGRRALISHTYGLAADAAPPAWLDPQRGGVADAGLFHSVFLPVRKLIEIGLLTTSSDDRSNPMLNKLGHKVAAIANMAKLAAKTPHGSRWEKLLSALTAVQAWSEQVDAQENRLLEVTAFGSNPGELRMYSYVPAGLPANAPLVVVLHGCTQSAASYNKGSGWSTLADRYGFALLLPQQQFNNNPLRCFNWFRPEDNERERGEPLSIRQMVDRMLGDHRLDSEAGLCHRDLVRRRDDQRHAGDLSGGVRRRCGHCGRSLPYCEGSAGGAREHLPGAFTFGRRMGRTGAGSVAACGTLAEAVGLAWRRRHRRQAGQCRRNHQAVDRPARHRPAADHPDDGRRLSAPGLAGAGRRRTDRVLYHHRHVARRRARSGRRTASMRHGGAFLQRGRDFVDAPDCRFLGPACRAPGGSRTRLPAGGGRQGERGRRQRRKWRADLQGRKRARAGRSDRRRCERSTCTASNRPFGLDVHGIISASLEAAGLLKPGRSRRPDSSAPLGIDVPGIISTALEAAGVLKGGSLRPPGAPREASLQTAGWEGTGWELLLDDPRAFRGGPMLHGQVSSGEQGALGARAQSIARRIVLGSQPELSYVRRLDLGAGVNDYTSASFRVLIDGQVVDEVTAIGMVHQETEWLRQAAIDLSRFANRTVTLTLEVAACSNTYSTVYARAWVDQITIQNAVDLAHC